MVSASATAPKLAPPKWYVGTVLFMLLLGAMTYATLAATSTGPATWVALGASAMIGCLFLAALVSLVGRRRPLQIAASGPVVISSPLALTVLLLSAWALIYVTSIAWVIVAITDFDAIETPGLVLVWVLASLASLPDLVRLFTGRIHRWQVILDDKTLTYRGYRTDITVPWSDVRGAAIQARGPAGVAIDLRANQPDIVVPAAAFLVPAEDLVQLVYDRRSMS